MIVISFTPSYPLLAYLLQFLGTVKTLVFYSSISVYLVHTHVFLLKYFLHTFHLKMLSFNKRKRFSHHFNLQVKNLEAVTLLSHKLKARV
jgi:hypothetical protein